MNKLDKKAKLNKKEKLNKKVIPERCNESIIHKGEQDDPNIYIYFYKNVNKIGKDSYSMPITILDDPKYKFKNSARYHRNWEVTRNKICDYEVSLNNNNMWKTIVDLLEDNYIKKKINRSHDDFNYKDKKEIEYTLPIIGHDITKLKIREKYKYLKFKNKKYPLNKMYLCININNPSFEKYDNFNFYDETKFNLYRLNFKLKLVSNENLYCDKSIYKINSKQNEMYDNSRNLCFFNSNYKYKSKNYNYIEIDLEENTNITHISTMGKKHYTYKFPNSDEQLKYDLKSEPAIQYITETDKNWITSYELKYRQHSYKKWHLLGKFTGNNDRMTEVVHCFDDKIFARYIKLIPISFNNYPDVQISLFGSELDIDKDELSNIKELSNNDKNTIVYSLYQPSKKRFHYKNSGYNNYILNNNVLKDKEKREEKKNIKKYIKKYNKEKIGYYDN